MQHKTGLQETLALMKDLRARCEWDAAQTHESLENLYGSNVHYGN